MIPEWVVEEQKSGSKRRMNEPSERIQCASCWSRTGGLEALPA
ncbi:MAG: hypothetical protein PWQ19_1597 [Tepidiphilus sp.]|jgi:hypothetical protein|nr:hypothetical protein [Tepidiphilus sp.]